ncbi:histidine--tRNA ligase [Candidatus Methylopumilus planktonicus]|uniref:histidine--tRNA ligase n=1 Tax=Candidatus Methylopumilus planktonicus TaxID=1581557 RepID=UPI0011214C3A|nr:histidine--tRNA ligase [Candidatus Methylopumilus planktonicus]QDD11036.1 histidine--tRNA ligase [Candidatus Methylopumilus planktonicus]QDD23506.1 histidine--tRNA ligase [Candidatus Methylopumilus planktonicus]
MSKKLQSVKGFYDVLPDKTSLWHFVEDKMREVLNLYAYEKINLPLVEPTSLFIDSVGTHTDIVEKEMYSWVDPLNEDQLTLRPEGTAGCVRAVIEHNLTYNGPIRLWYQGPMFRHENVQKGRQRQFNQVGAEAFGFDDANVDAEQILLLSRLWKALDIKDVELHINSIGDPEDRLTYRTELIRYFEGHQDVLDEDAKKRLHQNPLRILDSKNPAMQDMIEGAPKLSDYLNSEAKAHFDSVCDYLKEAGVPFKLNHRLVRGLDYYNRTVYEWVTNRLGSQGTIAGGGRYDYLIERLGGDKTSACGFGIGMERIILLLEDMGVVIQNEPNIYLVNLGNAAEKYALKLSETLRSHGLKVVLNSGGSSFKSQMKRADKSGAAFAAILGDDEMMEGVAQVKSLRVENVQSKIPLDELALFLLKQTS